MSEPEATTMRAERRWPMALAVLAAIGLQVGTPHAGRLRGWWIVPALEFALLVILLVVDPGRVDDLSRRARGLTLALITIMTVGTMLSLSLLTSDILHGTSLDANNLLGRGGAIWLTNVIAFALWYWELDRGGPAARAAGTASRRLPVPGERDAGAGDRRTGSRGSSTTSTCRSRTRPRSARRNSAADALGEADDDAAVGGLAAHGGAGRRPGGQRLPHRLASMSDHPADDDRRQGFDKMELLEVTVLALVAIATAWSGYQATQWGGRQAVLTGRPRRRGSRPTPHRRAAGSSWWPMRRCSRPG